MCSYFTRTHEYAVTLIVCSLLLLASVARAQEQHPQPKEDRYDELPNFGRVNERLYRGGQPGKGGLRRLAALGVKTIINLRDDDERKGGRIAIFQYSVQAPGPAE